MHSIVSSQLAHIFSDNTHFESFNMCFIPRLRFGLLFFGMATNGNCLNVCFDNVSAHNKHIIWWNELQTCLSQYEFKSKTKKTTKQKIMRIERNMKLVYLHLSHFTLADVYVKSHKQDLHCTYWNGKVNKPICCVCLYMCGKYFNWNACIYHRNKLLFLSIVS